MRLLDVYSFELKQFFVEHERPSYAILSHTWGDGEVSFQDLPTPAARSMPGFSKIKKCCELAIQDHFQYVWIDTCCIDKTSSAELSEAINSMYQWYKSAAVCYAYLSDVKTGDDPSDPNSSFSYSRWFTRGWTLQELLAPHTVVFHDANWTEIGTKFTLQADISRITGIAREALASKLRTNFSIAQRMSWAAKRNTTRVEDIAYCLMGIFNVNMPTLYGEGEKAFIRLQHEILNRSDDHTIFAWTTGTEVFTDWIDPEEELPDFWDHSHHETGILASSPSHFFHSQGVRQLEVTSPTYPFSMTNKGLHIWLPLVPWHDKTKELDVYRAVLNCFDIDGARPLSIYLRRKPSGEYYRIYSDILGEIHTQYDTQPVELYIRDPEPRIPLSREAQFNIVENPSIKQSYTSVGGSSWYELPDISPFINIGPINRGSPDNFLHIIAENKDYPRVRAMVVVAIEYDDEDAGTTLCCAVYSGKSEIEKAKQCRNFYDLDRITKNVDRIAEQLPTGHIFSVGFRRLPVYLDRVRYGIVMLFAPPNSNFSISGRVVHRPPIPPPRLTLHIDSDFDASCYPSESWCRDLDFTWNPPEQEKLTLLRLTHPKMQLPLLVVCFVDSDVRVLFVSPSLASTLASQYGSSHSQLDAAILSHVKTNMSSGSQRWLQSSDFPQERRTDEGTMVIKLRPRRFFREPGHQMAVEVS